MRLRARIRKTRRKRAQLTVIRRQGAVAGELVYHDYSPGDKGSCIDCGLRQSHIVHNIHMSGKAVR
jgi:hypothetical protein